MQRVMTRVGSVKDITPSFLSLLCVSGNMHERREARRFGSSVSVRDGTGWVHTPAILHHKCITNVHRLAVVVLWGITSTLSMGETLCVGDDLLMSHISTINGVKW